MNSVQDQKKGNSSSRDESLDNLRDIVHSRLHQAGITHSEGKPGNGRFSSVLSPRTKP